MEGELITFEKPLPMNFGAKSIESESSYPSFASDFEEEKKSTFIK